MANKLKMGEVPVPELFEEASVYFADIYEFTSLMKDSQPMQIIELLNDYFRAFDAVIENFKVYKASLNNEKLFNHNCLSTLLLCSENH